MTPWSIYVKSFKNKYTPNIINTIPIINITSIPTHPFLSLVLDQRKGAVVDEQN